MHPGMKGTRICCFLPPSFEAVATRALTTTPFCPSFASKFYHTMFTASSGYSLMYFWCGTSDAPPRERGSAGSRAFRRRPAALLTQDGCRQEDIKLRATFKREYEIYLSHRLGDHSNEIVHEQELLEVSFSWLLPLALLALPAIKHSN